MLVSLERQAAANKEIDKSEVKKLIVDWEDLLILLEKYGVTNNKDTQIQFTSDGINWAGAMRDQDSTMEILYKE